MKNKKMLALCTGLFLLFTLLFPIDQQLEESFTCHVLDQLDESYRDQVTVTLTGTYSDYLIRKDKFVGRIAIAGYEFLSPDAQDIELTIGDYEGNWIQEYMTTYPSIRYLGTFYATEDFESFFMWLHVPDEENPGASHGRYFVTCPEMSFKEIYSILDSGS